MSAKTLGQTYDASKPDNWPEGRPLKYAQNGRIYTRRGQAKRGAMDEHCSCCARDGLRQWVELRNDPRATYHYKYCVNCIDAMARSARGIKR